MKTINLRKTLSRTGAILTAMAVASTALFAVTTTSPSQASAAVSFNGTRNCDGNAVMYCGAMSTSEVTSKFNASATIRDIYSYFGINGQSIASMPADAVAGQVTKSGDVVVNGQVVATNALTAGRSYIAGSARAKVGDTVFYTRHPSVSFLNNSLSAFVVMKNGVFQFAVISSCGNPVSGSATQQQQKPKPQPTSLTCANLTVDKVDNSQYDYTVTAGGQNYSNVSYTVRFGDGSEYDGTSNAVSHTYAKADNYQITAYVHGDLATGQHQIVTSANCASSVTVQPPQQEYCKPGVPVGSPECQPTIQKECKPGVPVGSPECQPIKQMCTIPGKENLPVNSPKCVAVTTTTKPAPPKQLVDTGPGSVLGIFAATGIAGTIVSRLYLRRRYQA